MANEYAQHTTLRSPLGRVRGLGSAKSGMHHWLGQRITSIALLPLTLWFVFTAATMAGAPYAEVAAWIGRPVNALLFLLLIGFTFHHTAAGIQVILEDYVNQEGWRMALVYGVRGLCLVLGLASALAVLRLAI